MQKLFVSSSSSLFGVWGGKVLGGDWGAAPGSQGGDAPAVLSAAMFSSSLRTARKEKQAHGLCFHGGFSLSHALLHLRVQRWVSKGRTVLLTRITSHPYPQFIVLYSPSSLVSGKLQLCISSPVPLHRTPCVTLARGENWPPLPTNFSPFTSVQNLPSPCGAVWWLLLRKTLF